MEFRPVFVYGDESFQPSISAPPWGPEDEPLGVTRWTALGAPVPALSARYARARVPLRIHETEWLDFLALIEWGQTGQGFTWQPDPDLDEIFSVYLDEPVAGMDWQPSRGQYPRVLEVSITIRGIGNEIPWAHYFD